MAGYQLDGDSAEAVAYALMQNILRTRGYGDGDMVLPPNAQRSPPITEEELLELYGRCLDAVR